jgi:hypothetical protein
MKNPKWRCAYPGTHKVKFGGKFLTQWSGYHLFLNQNEGGTITADKTKGGYNETVTLSSIPNYGYTFDGYSLTGSTLTGDQFNFVSSNVTAEGSFTEMPKHTLTLQQTTGGTITANKLTGYINENANLSYTANFGYSFNGWQTTGASVQNNKIPFTQDTTARGKFVYDPIPSSAQTNVGGGTWMNHDMDFDDGGTGIKKLTNLVYYYNYYSSENASPVILRVELPGPEYYYTLEAAHRIANKISGWHVPTMNDWKNYIGVSGPIHLPYYTVISQDTRKWFPSGANQIMTYSDTTFNAMPYMGYENMVRFDVSAGAYRVKTGSEPFARNLISQWWVASGVELSGITYTIQVDGINFVAQSCGAGNYRPVRLKKD